MTTQPYAEYLDAVGPVLEACPLTDAVVAAIRQENRDVTVMNHHAYLRVLVPRRCVVTRAAIEQHLGHAFRLPADLELVMSSFKGRFSVCDAQAEWALTEHATTPVTHHAAPTPPVPSGQKTYWHLLAQRRMPSDYDVATSRLHYYTQKGFEVATPIADWYRRYQQDSSLQCHDWDRFADPRQTTYTTYLQLQQTKEAFVDGLLAAIETTDADRRLSEEWLRTLARVVAPLRYPWHGFQMIAAYLGSMAPAGRIAIAAMFQAADEMRRIQRIAYRVRQLQQHYPSFGMDSQTVWEQDPTWQPLREVVERLLVTYDWGEAFVGLNLVVKPMMDELLMVQLGQAARRAGDHQLEEMLYSLHEDCRWHRDWSEALARVAVGETPANRQVIAQWRERWQSPAARAASTLAPLLEAMDHAAAGR